MKAVYVREVGGPEVLKLEEAATPQPASGQALIRVEASGVNFFDIRQRTGDFKSPLPLVMGNEGAGVVEAVGPGVDLVKKGDRVAWQMEQGSYATHAAIAAEKLIPVPDGVDTRTAAAGLLQGLMAHCLATAVYPLKPADTCLVLAAAGGVGGLLIQIAKARGARVIGVVSSDRKAARAKEVGADEVIVQEKEDYTEAARRLTGGRGVDVVYDAIGKDTFSKSVESVRGLGYMIMYGQASGPVPPIDTHILQQKGGRFLTRVTVASHVATREALLARTNELYGWIRDGKLKLRIEKTFPLAEAAKAQETLSGRGVMGKLLLDTTV